MRLRFVGQTGFSGAPLNTHFLNSNTYNMAVKLSKVKKLNNMILALQDYAQEVRGDMDEKMGWLQGKSEKYQESEAGQEWQAHLEEVERVLDDIDNLEEVNVELD